MKASLADLRAFTAVARHRSFRLAADSLGVTRSTLSHAVRGLEGELGARLLNRTTRSVGLTPAGSSLLKRLEPTLRDLDDMLAQVVEGGDEVVGTVRVNGIEAAIAWLARHIVPAFLDRHPRVELDLVADDRLVDVIAEGFDAGVRLREAVPQDMVAVPFGGEVRFLAVASPAYLERAGTPRTPDDLRRHRCIRQRLASGKAYRWEFAKSTQAVSVDVPGPLTLNKNPFMVEAAIGDLGIAYVPESFAREALASGKLRMVLEDWSPAIDGLCLYYPGHRLVPPALRAFVDALRQVEDVPVSS